jgi:lipopolysaccharide export system protein LptA
MGNFIDNLLSYPDVNIKVVGTTGSDYVVDGSGDNIEIQQALDALESPGGVVFCPLENYYLLNRVKIPSNVLLVGTGNTNFNASGGFGVAIGSNAVNGVEGEVMVVNKHAGDSGTNLNTGTGALITVDSNLGVIDINFKGNGSNQTRKVHGVGFQWVDKPIVRNIHCYDCGIKVVNPGTQTNEGNGLRESAGILIRNCNSPLVESSRQVTTDGVIISYCKRPVVKHIIDNGIYNTIINNTNNIELDYSYDLSSAYGVTPPATVTPNYLINNLLINSNFDRWARGTSFSNPTNAVGSRTVERFLTCRASFTTGMSITRQTSSDVGSRYKIRIQRTAANNSAAEMVIEQPLETSEVIKLRGQYLTLSFLAAKGADFSASGNKLACNIIYGTGTDECLRDGMTGQTSLTSQDNTITSSMVRYTMTTNAVVPNNASSLTVKINYVPTGVAGTNDWFELSQVKLETGQTATAYQAKNIIDEINACLRFFRKSFNYDIVPQQNTNLTGAIQYHAINGVNIRYTTRFDIPMRNSSYVVTTYNPNAANALWRNLDTSADGNVDTSQKSENALIIALTTPSFNTGAWIAIHYTADAEF